MSDQEFLSNLNSYLGGQEYRKGIAAPVFLYSDGSINRAKTLSLVVYQDLDPKIKQMMIVDKTA